MDCIHKVLNLMKEYHFNRTLMVILNCNCISLIINFIVFMGEKMEGGRKCNKSQSKSGKWCTCIKLTIARKWRISIAPFLSTLIGWIFMPAIWALAGFVPWAEVGIRHTYIRQQYSVSEWQSSKHSDSYINQYKPQNHTWVNQNWYIGWIGTIYLQFSGPPRWHGDRPWWLLDQHTLLEHHCQPKYRAHL